MADSTNKVTIDADYFAKLYIAAKDGKHSQQNCAVCPFVQEREELMASLHEMMARLHDAERENNKYRAMPTEYKRCKDRLAAAERCIEEMWSKMQTFDIPDRQRLIEIEDIIRAYREQKEAAR